MIVKYLLISAFDVKRTDLNPPNMFSFLWEYSLLEYVMRPSLSSSWYQISALLSVVWLRHHRGWEGCVHGPRRPQLSTVEHLWPARWLGQPHYLFLPLTMCWLTCCDLHHFFKAQHFQNQGLNPRPGRGVNASATPQFFCDECQTISRIVLKFSIASGASFVQLLVKNIFGSCQVTKLWCYNIYNHWLLLTKS